MADQAATPFLPGGIGVARLKAYEAGGTPHVHLASTEAYYVIAGHGAVQTLSASGLGEIALEPGSLVWFAPGVIHRLMNADKKLDVLLIGQNGDLSVTEDAICCFGPDVMADAAKYAEASAATDLPSATRRRDAAVKAFDALRSDFQFKGKAALDKFFVAAGKLAKPKGSKWYQRWNAGPNAANTATSVHLNNLRHGHVGHVAAAKVGVLNPPDARSELTGLCGNLAIYQPEGSVT